MTTLTHVIFSGLCSVLACQSAKPSVLITGALCGALPDVDTRASLAGRVLRPLSKRLESYGHRQITHSLCGTLCFALVALGVWGLVQIGADYRGVELPWTWPEYGAAIVGYGAGWGIDACTKTGVPAFWPKPARLVFPLNSEYRFSTGSAAERLLTCLLAACLGGAVYWHGANFAAWDVARLFGARFTTPADIYRQHAVTHEVWADIVGHRAATSEPVTVRARVVGLGHEAELLIAPDAATVLRVAANGAADIVADKPQLTLGQPLRVSLHTLSVPQPMRLGEVLARAHHLSDAATLDGVLEVDGVDVMPNVPPTPETATVRLENGTGQGTARLRLRHALKSHLAAFAAWSVRGEVTAREENHDVL